jgi:hypothetical protein
VALGTTCLLTSLYRHFFPASTAIFLVWRLVAISSRESTLATYVVAATSWPETLLRPPWTHGVHYLLAPHAFGTAQSSTRHLPLSCICSGQIWCHATSWSGTPLRPLGRSLPVRQPMCLLLPLARSPTLPLSHHLFFILFFGVQHLVLAHGTDRVGFPALSCYLHSFILPGSFHIAYCKTTYRGVHQ